MPGLVPGPVQVIAEMGACHAGRWAWAERLVAAAHWAGADGVKAQYWSSVDRLVERYQAPELREAWTRCQMPEAWLPRLAAAAQAGGLEFLCTTYLPEDIPVVAPYVERFKVGSFEAGDHEFLRAHVGYGKALIISTGMMTWEEVHALHEFLDECRPDVTARVLHCVSGYPTPADEANLGAITAGAFDGYSDHTLNLLTGAFAVMAGAELIEVHLRLAETPADNPDYGHSLDPTSLKEYVRLVRLAERMRGDADKRPQPSEQSNLRYRVGGSPP